MGFHVIQPTQGLSGAGRRRASRSGPSAVALATSYESLLSSAGFATTSVTDITDEYASTLRRWIDAHARREAAIRDAVGSEAFDERAEGRRETLSAIDDGVLSRFLYTAERR